jgi:curved DNA-binding protein CbpA
MDLYQNLGVDEQATAGDIKAAYRGLSKKYHPDVYKGGDDRFKQINLAYKVLSDPDKRKLYDDHGIAIDENPDHIQNLVVERMGSIANGWLDNMIKGNKVSLVDFVITNLDNGINHIRKAISEIQHQICALENIHKRLSHSSGKSLIHGVIDNRIAALKKGVRQNETELMVIGELKKEISEYDYEEEALFTAMSSSTSYTTSSHTFEFRTL